MDDRYKKRGLQFNSALDSRVLRAVHNQERQRERRNDTFNLRRQMDNLEDSLQGNEPVQSSKLAHVISSKTHKKDDMYQRRLERYQELMKWKDLRKKKMEKEKKQRVGSFKAGVYHPSPPKFLVSEDSKSEQMTPLSSSKKKMATPGTSLRKVPVFHTGGTPATSLLRVPQFHTGLTPSDSLKKSHLLTRKPMEQDNVGPSRRTRAALKRNVKKESIRSRETGGFSRGRNSRKRNLASIQEDLGVKPLPLTPQQTVRTFPQPYQKVETAAQAPAPSSFAPSNFAFKFEALQQPCVRSVTEMVSTAYPMNHSSEAQKDSSPSRPEDNFGNKKDVSYSESNVQMKDDCIDEQEMDNHNHNSVFQENISETVQSYESNEKVSLPKILRNESNEHEFDRKNIDDISALKVCEDEILCGLENKEAKYMHSESADNIKEINSVSLETAKDKCITDKEESMDTDTDNKIDNENEEDADDIIKIEVKDELRADDAYTCVSLQQSESHREKSRRSSRIVTPAKCLTRKSVGCCYGDLVTPTLSRLRPRTPCSRSTRRSLSAHCDTPYDLCTPVTQTLSRRRSCRSVKKEAKHDKPQDSSLDTDVTTAGNPVEDITLAVNTTDKQPLTPAVNDSDIMIGKSTSDMVSKGILSPLLSSENMQRQAKGQWTVETSPWVDRVPRSRKKTRTVSDLHGVFDDIPTDGSPIPAHLIPSPSESSNAASPHRCKSSHVVMNKGLGEDDLCTNLLPLLKPTLSEDTESPALDVWGEDSPAIITAPPHTTIPGTPKSSRPQQIPLPVLLEETKGDASACPELEDAKVDNMLSANNPVSPANAIPISSGDCDLKKDQKRAEKRKSRKSVMFNVVDQETDNAETYRIPGTPIRASSRLSMGLFTNLDLNADNPKEDQELIIFDSPKSEKKISTRRKSCRVSLLPGMNLSPEKVTESQMPDDLITWDSPIQPKRASRSTAVSSLTTPVRRSRRLSKAQDL